VSIDSEVRLLSPEELANPAVPTAGLSQASESVDGIIQSIGVVFGMLIGWAVSALSERRLAGVCIKSDEYLQLSLAVSG
jgi:hypothetical protein